MEDTTVWVELLIGSQPSARSQTASRTASIQWNELTFISLMHRFSILIKAGFANKVLIIVEYTMTPSPLSHPEPPLPKYRYPLFCYRNKQPHNVYTMSGLRLVTSFDGLAVLTVRMYIYLWSMIWSYVRQSGCVKTTFLLFAIVRCQPSNMTRFTPCWLNMTKAAYNLMLRNSTHVRSYMS